MALREQVLRFAEKWGFLAHARAAEWRQDVDALLAATNIDAPTALLQQVETLALRAVAEHWTTQQFVNRLTQDVLRPAAAERSALARILTNQAVPPKRWGR